jgi:glycosyltransferase involved in cell wall biosynthesis
MSAVIRVAILMQRYHPFIGGAEQQAASLAPLLRARGVEVTVITRHFAGLQRFEIIEDTPVYRLPVPGPKPLASMAFTLSALPLLRRLHPDVIHAQELLSPTTTGVAAKRLLGIPVVTKVLGGGESGDLAKLKRKAFGQQRITNFQKHVDAFIVISREIDTELSDVGIPPEQRVFIPNGVNIARFLPPNAEQKRAQRTTLGLPEDGLIVVFTGRLAAEKRLHHAVKAWPAVRAVCPDALLLIVGAGPEEASLKALAGEGVRFAGSTNDVAPFLKAADIFLLPSAREGLSNAMLEAMATGLPVLATQVGGATDLITHGESGWLIPPDDPAALQTAFLTLIGDTELCSRLGAAGRERILRDYQLETTAARLHALYQRVIPARNRIAVRG